MFKYTGNLHNVKQAVDAANELIKNEKFLNQIRELESFDMATCDGEYIANQIVGYFRKLKKPYMINYDDGSFSALRVNVYRSKNPWSRALGYFNPSKPNDIFLNSRKLNRSKGSIVATLIHEMIHWLDAKDKDLHSFGHGDNSPIGKADTAPFYIDNLAEAFIDEKQPNFNNNESSNIVTYTPWWKRLINWIF